MSGWCFCIFYFDYGQKNIYLLFFSLISINYKKGIIDLTRFKIFVPALPRSNKVALIKDFFQ